MFDFYKFDKNGLKSLYTDWNMALNLEQRVDILEMMMDWEKGDSELPYFEFWSSALVNKAVVSIDDNMNSDVLTIVIKWS